MADPIKYLGKKKTSPLASERSPKQERFKKYDDTDEMDEVDDVAPNYDDSSEDEDQIVSQQKPTSKPDVEPEKPPQSDFDKIKGMPGAMLSSLEKMTMQERQALGISERFYQIKKAQAERNGGYKNVWVEPDLIPEQQKPVQDTEKKSLAAYMPKMPSEKNTSVQPIKASAGLDARTKTRKMAMQQGTYDGSKWDEKTQTRILKDGTRLSATDAKQSAKKIETNIDDDGESGKIKKSSSSNKKDVAWMENAAARGEYYGEQKATSLKRRSNDNGQYASNDFLYDKLVPQKSSSERRSKSDFVDALNQQEPSPQTQKKPEATKKAGILEALGSLMDNVNSAKKSAGDAAKKAISYLPQKEKEPSLIETIGSAANNKTKEAQSYIANAAQKIKDLYSGSGTFGEDMKNRASKVLSDKAAALKNDLKVLSKMGVSLEDVLQQVSLGAKEKPDAAKKSGILETLGGLMDGANSARKSAGDAVKKAISYLPQKEKAPSLIGKSAVENIKGTEDYAMHNDQIKRIAMKEGIKIISPLGNNTGSIAFAPTKEQAKLLPKGVAPDDSGVVTMDTTEFKEWSARIKNKTNESPKKNREYPGKETEN